MKKAFTLIELIIVIVVIGIVVAVAFPKFKRENLIEVADQVLQDIRYTQHLAMIDDKFNPNDNEWYKTRWTIEFTENSSLGSISDCSGGASRNCLTYQIYSDLSKSGNLNSSDEVAKDPSDSNRYMSAGWSGISNADKARVNKKLNIELKYAVNDVDFTGGCGHQGNKSISFDELGRPYRKVSTTGGGGSSNAYNRRILNDCTIVLYENRPEKKCIKIKIEKETGYSRILPEDADCKW